MPPTNESLYSPHPAIAHMQAIANNLAQKTGRDLASWVALVHAEAPADTKGRMVWLREKHGLGRDTAMVIVERADGASDTPPEALVEAMFAGPRAGLLPIYHRLLELALGLGPDVKACPGTTYVSLMRDRQFAVIRPTTLTRVDLGLALPDVAPGERLKEAKGLGSTRTVRMVGLAAPEAIDAEVEGWLKLAYEAEQQDRQAP